MEQEMTYSAFSEHRCIASGDVQTMVLGVKDHLDKGGNPAVLIFEDKTGKEIDFDFRGTSEEVLSRLATHPAVASAAPTESVPNRGPGRPKLGVVSREISLLPRHWEWLEQHPRGISVTLRTLIDEARKREGTKNLMRDRQDAANRFMWAMAGDFPHFEEASRALYAGEREKLEALMVDWPEDVRGYVTRLLG